MTQEVFCISRNFVDFFGFASRSKFECIKPKLRESEYQKHMYHITGLLYCSRKLLPSHIFSHTKTVVRYFRNSCDFVRIRIDEWKAEMNSCEWIYSQNSSNIGRPVIFLLMPTMTQVHIKHTKCTKTKVLKVSSVCKINQMLDKLMKCCVLIVHSIHQNSWFLVK